MNGTPKYLPKDKLIVWASHPGAEEFHISITDSSGKRWSIEQTYPGLVDETAKLGTESISLDQFTPVFPIASGPLKITVEINKKDGSEIIEGQFELTDDQKKDIWGEQALPKPAPESDSDRLDKLQKALDSRSQETDKKIKELADRITKSEEAASKNQKSLSDKFDTVSAQMKRDAETHKDVVNQLIEKSKREIGTTLNNTAVDYKKQLTEMEERLSDSIKQIAEKPAPENPPAPAASGFGADVWNWIKANHKTAVLGGVGIAIMLLLAFLFFNPHFFQTPAHNEASDRSLLVPGLLATNVTATASASTNTASVSVATTVPAVSSSNSVTSSQELAIAAINRVNATIDELIAERRRTDDERAETAKVTEYLHIASTNIQPSVVIGDNTILNNSMVAGSSISHAGINQQSLIDRAPRIIHRKYPSVRHHEPTPAPAPSQREPCIEKSGYIEVPRNPDIFVGNIGASQDYRPYLVVPPVTVVPPPFANSLGGSIDRRCEQRPVIIRPPFHRWH